MSFDVAFWRYTETLNHNHVEVLASLNSGTKLHGVAMLEADAMIARLAELLSAWERVEERIWEKPNQYLQVHNSPQHLWINMSFSAARPVLLRISTPMRRFGCGLWNPQTNQRLPGYDEAGAKGEK
jgi:hypothetical protein